MFYKFCRILSIELLSLTVLGNLESKESFRLNRDFFLLRTSSRLRLLSHLYRAQACSVAAFPPSSESVHVLRATVASFLEWLLPSLIYTVSSRRRGKNYKTGQDEEVMLELSMTQ